MYRFFAKPGMEVTVFMFLSDDVVWASLRYSAEEILRNLRHTNVVIGAHVTVKARIHLYGFIDTTKAVLYCDTNSVI